MKQIITLILFSLLLHNVTAQQPSLIPQPVSVKTSKGSFIINTKTVLAARNDEDRRTARLFNAFLKEQYGLSLDIDRAEGKNYIRFNTRTFIKAPEKETYTITTSNDGIIVEGDSHAATFQGMQTVVQLLPTPVAGPVKQKVISLKVPFVTIYDYPRFPYRGMHLDVSRHFFPLSFVKKYVDELARHKFNYFHWHLTDDQGWRIEIKRYPELISRGAYRNGTIVGRYPGISNDNKRYGGYYTQEEVKELVRYAADRHITVIPEIEMPGHASAAIAAFPSLSCFPDENTKLLGPVSEASRAAQAGGTRKIVQETWGVFEDIFCAGKDSTFLFLQNVLDEVLPLFPSNYIHVGGDEAPKNNWKRCPNCQARIRAEGLKDEHELQSYFVQRMEKYLNAKGRTLIGWDEILEGGLAPNAVVMSWQGEKGGIVAARAAHHVIMTPQKPVYFDHSQTRNEDSLVIGGYNPLDAVYAYEPVPKELDSVAAKYILGAQANIWTEYIPYPSKVEYHAFPRMTALSEVLWSPKAARNWSSFEKRLPDQLARYDARNVNYSRAFYDLRMQLLRNKNNTGMVLRLKKSTPKGLIAWQTPNGMIYTSAADSIDVPVVAEGPYRSWLATGNAGARKFKGAQYMAKAKVDEISSPNVQRFVFHKAIGNKASIATAPTERYPGQGGALSLVNGIYSNKGLSHPDWLGWIGNDMEATIDLGKQQNISSVKMHTLNQPGSWVYLPQFVEVFVSQDGKNYTSAGRGSEFVTDTLTMGFITVTFKTQPARYIKVFAKNYGVIPEGQPGAGNKSWIFTDELQVY